VSEDADDGLIRLTDIDGSSVWVRLKAISWIYEGIGAKGVNIHFGTGDLVVKEDTESIMKKILRMWTVVKMKEE